MADFGSSAKFNPELVVPERLLDNWEFEKSWALSPAAHAQTTPKRDVRNINMRVRIGSCS